ncbi:MAG TPA: hypothetical protein VHL59_00760, partial [Thermoanaerobaculia bacterium]|nr:hypothetical protein [Thermoanaerobaculia bacterium]
ATAPRESRVAIASTGTTHLVAWESESHQILGARFNADGTLIDSSAIEISSGPRPQSRPVIGTDGSRFLVVWSMDEPLGACAGFCDTPLSLHAAVVTTSGFVTGPPIAIAPAYSRDAAVVWNGAEYAIFWERHNHVEARRVDRHGNLRDAAPRAVTFPGGILGATWNGREYLIGLAFRAPLAVGSVDRELRLIETVAVRSAYVPATPVVFFPRENHTALMAFQAIGEELVSRATGRLVGDDVNPPRRRAVSRR